MTGAPSEARRYGLAVASSALALVLAALLVPLSGGAPFTLFLAAVMLSAWYGGLGPGLLATALGGLATVYFFFPFPYSLAVASVESALRLAVFLLVALLVSSLNDNLRQARRRAEVARARAEQAEDAQRVLAELNRQLYLEAERAVGVRDELLASASHELRTPLGHIKGFVSTLRQADVEWDRETEQDFLAEIEREADRLARLIGDLLDLSSLESGGLEAAARTPRSVHSLVAGGLDRVRGLLDGRPLAVELPPDLPPVLADAGQLERVIANVVENAAKYAPSDTSIRLSAAHRGPTVALAVEDEGPGIPPEQLERIFEKFVRLGPPATPVSGAGLGLAICRRIVEAHGGRIYAENRQPRGARLVVELPTDESSVECRVLSSEWAGHKLGTQDSALKTQDSELRTQHSALRTDRCPPSAS